MVPADALGSKLKTLNSCFLWILSRSEREKNNKNQELFDSLH